MKSDVNLFRFFLIDVDVKKYVSLVVRNCVEEIKEIVFDVEDVIEIFILKKDFG